MIRNFLKWCNMRDWTDSFNLSVISWERTIRDILKEILNIIYLCTLYIHQYFIPWWDVWSLEPGAMHYFQLISNVMVPQYEMAEIFIFLLSSPQGCNQNHLVPDFPLNGNWKCKCLILPCHQPVLTSSAPAHKLLYQTFKQLAIKRKSANPLQMTRTFNSPNLKSKIVLHNKWYYVNHVRSHVKNLKRGQNKKLVWSNRRN